MEEKRILITGVAGFIGAALACELFRRYKKIHITGLDSMNDYYDVSIKEYRLRMIEKEVEGHNDSSWCFVKGYIEDNDLLKLLFCENKFNIVVNLAAQAGVRYSITNPEAYISSNIIGFFNVLEKCRHSFDMVDDCEYSGVEHLVYASSSSVYGSNRKMPYAVDDKTDNPISLYAATKKSNELMAHAYSTLYNISTTGLRFFTVYGPAGRPDMAYFSFADKLRVGDKIKIHNYGKCERDFTYIDDVVEGIIRVMEKPPQTCVGNDGERIPPYALYNIGNNRPENLLKFVEVLQREMVTSGILPRDYDFEAHRELIPQQAGDVVATCADVSSLEETFGYRPTVEIGVGLRKFVEWYKEFYRY